MIGSRNCCRRPNILLLIDKPSASILAFTNNLKKGGLLIIGSAILGSFETAIPLTKILKNAWNAFLKNYKIKGFAQLAADEVYRHGVQSMMLGSGLGALHSNTVCVPLLKADHVFKGTDDIVGHTHRAAAVLAEAPKRDHELPELAIPYDCVPVASFTEYCGILHDALQYDHNVLVAANFAGGTHIHKHTFRLGFTSAKKFTDVWVFGDFGVVDSNVAGTMHALWGYSNSPYPNHIKHPNLVVPAPLETDEGGSAAGEADTGGMFGLCAFLTQLGAIADQTRVDPTGKRLKKNHALRIMHVPSSAAGASGAAEAV